MIQTRIAIKRTNQKFHVPVLKLNIFLHLRLFGLAQCSQSLGSLPEFLAQVRGGQRPFGVLLGDWRR